MCRAAVKWRTEPEEVAWVTAWAMGEPAISSGANAVSCARGEGVVAEREEDEGLAAAAAADSIVRMWRRTEAKVASVRSSGGARVRGTSVCGKGGSEAT